MPYYRSFASLRFDIVAIATLGGSKEIWMKIQILVFISLYADRVPVIRQTYLDSFIIPFALPDRTFFSQKKFTEKIMYI